MEVILLIAVQQATIAPNGSAWIEAAWLALPETCGQLQVGTPGSLEERGGSTGDVALGAHGAVRVLVRNRRPIADRAARHGGAPGRGSGRDVDAGLHIGCGETIAAVRAAAEQDGEQDDDRREF
jgi:hypothetical protein